MWTRVIIVVAYGLFLFLACVGVVNAAALGVSPVRVTLSENQKIGTLTVRNDGTEPVPMQMELMSWAQEEGEDIYTPTREILANPPIFTIPAGGSQLIRIGLRRAPDAQHERTYRIFVQELPPPPSPDFNGAKILMRISLPLFVLPKVTTKPMLRWKAVRTSDGALKISLINNGNAHIQIANFSLSLPDSAQPWLTQQSASYVLMGKSRNWIVPANPENPTPKSGTTIKLIAQTDAGKVEAEIMIAP
jgi:fimbrial chaperone protein